MNIYPTYQYNNFQYQPQNYAFTGKMPDISVEDLMKLVNSGKTVKQIAQELNISLTTYYSLLRIKGIAYNRQTPKHFDKITKEQVQSLLDSGLTIDAVCKQLKISRENYKDLERRLGFKHPKTSLHEKGTQVTEQALRQAISDGLSIKTICEKFQITQSIYFKLLKDFNIQTFLKEKLNHNKGITIEQIVALIEEGVPTGEILKRLKISQQKFDFMINKHGIVTKNKKAKENIAQITKERLEELVNSGKKVKEICAELKIPERTYTRLLNKFGIITQRQKERQHIKSITTERLQSLVDEGLSVAEICHTLELETSTFYKLLKQRHIKYNYLHNHGEIHISRDRLKQLLESGKTIQECANELGIGTTTFQHKVKVENLETLYKASIEKLATISKQELEDALNSGLTVKEVCQKFDLTHSNYLALLHKYNLETPTRKILAKTASITKEQIQELLNSGKSPKEICKELNISQRTYYRIYNSN